MAVVVNVSALLILNDRVDGFIKYKWSLLEAELEMTTAATPDTMA